LEKCKAYSKKIIRQEHRITVFVYFIGSESISPSTKKSDRPSPFSQKKAIASSPLDRKKRSPLTVKINSDRPLLDTDKKRSPLTDKDKQRSPLSL
jgi:hypothetical protein